MNGLLVSQLRNLATQHEIADPLLAMTLRAAAAEIERLQNLAERANAPERRFIRD
jgi:hypothetical protein